MNFEIITQNQTVAVLCGESVMITDADSALDVLMTAKYDYHADRIAVSKNLICEDFFELRTGIAGELLQKFINYHGKLAVYGDFSGYTSKALHDFLYESNHGRDIFFVNTKQEAIRKLMCI